MSRVLRAIIGITISLIAMLALLAVLQPREPVRAKPGVSTTIMIHEFESDTPQSGTDTAYEWFELYNATTSTITLTNWIISDAQSSDVVPTVVISPNDFVVVAASISFTVNYPGFTGTAVYLGGSIGNGLSNTGDCLTLADETGAIIDQVSYGSNTCGFAFNLSASSAGQSWERDPIGLDTDSASDWVRRTSPTPGYGYTSPPAPPLISPGSVLISAVHFDGHAAGDSDEGFRLTNVSTQLLTLTNWVALYSASAINLTGTLSPGQAIWLTKQATAFEQQFGFKPDYEYELNSDPSVPDLSVTGSVPTLGPNAELTLREGAGNWIDAVVWGTGGITDTGWLTGWVGSNVQRYSNGDVSATGQIIYRKLDEATGKIITDTDRAIDWANDRTDPVSGRKAQYPGWDLEKFWQTAKVTGTATLTVAISPDNAYRVISDVLGSAQQSIVMEMHTFDNLGLLDVVTKTIGRGVSVTILLEGGPVGGLDNQEKWVCQQIEAAGGQCWFMITDTSNGNTIHARYDYLHAKMILVDDRVVAIGSENLSSRTLAYDDFADGTVGHRGVYLVTDAGGVVSRALEIWNADFDPVNHRDLYRWTITDTKYGPPPIGFTPDYSIEVSGYRIRYPIPLRVTAPMTFELVTAPESALRASDSLLGLIGRSGAGDAIDVEQLDEPPHWGDSASNPIDDPNLRLQALIDAANRGAKVRLLLDRYFDDSTLQTSNAATVQYIESLRAISPTLHDNLEARLGDPARYGVHNKMFLFNLAGRKLVHAGSLNGTETSNKVNREVALQVESSAAYDYLHPMFEYDWAFQPRIYLPLMAQNYIAPPNHLLISKVFYLGSTSIVTGSEWVQVYNPTNITVTLSGYKLGDQAAPGSTGFTVDGMWMFPPTVVITPGNRINVATTALGFFNKYGRYPDYVFFGAGIQMIPDIAYTPNISFSLANTGDEVLLLGPADQLVDGVAWGTGGLPGNVSCVAIDPNQYPLGNPYISRSPLWKDTDNCPNDFAIDTTATP
jgi:phosphatidylserine/phosphatidylglycerophosphate/cardiolipin synthase-like enzyme